MIGVLWEPFLPSSYPKGPATASESSSPPDRRPSRLLLPAHPSQPTNFDLPTGTLIITYSNEDPFHTIALSKVDLDSPSDCIAFIKRRPALLVLCSTLDI